MISLKQVQSLLSIVHVITLSVGVLTSDTDYRIFKQYKNVTGIDLAYYRNGYPSRQHLVINRASNVYHTDRDTMDIVESGSIQHLGDNVLAIIREFTTCGILDKQVTPTAKLIYYDVLGALVTSTH
jgi:hypothetical protein